MKNIIEFLKRLFFVLFVEPKQVQKQVEKASLGKKSLAILVIQEGGRG